jgi:hypothetical protein
MLRTLYANAVIHSKIIFIVFSCGSPFQMTYQLFSRVKEVRSDNVNNEPTFFNGKGNYNNQLGIGLFLQNDTIIAFNRT